MIPATFAGFVAVCAAMLVAVAGPSPAVVHADTTLSASAVRAGVVLFLSYPAEGRPAFDAAALQAGSWDRIAAVMRDRGREVVSRAEIEPLMRRWGVRTGLLVNDGFLKDVAGSVGVGELVICDLMIFEDRILLCGRSVRTDTDRVVWADEVEAPLLSDGEAGRADTLGRWLEPAGSAAQELAGRWDAHAAPTGSSQVSLLPVRTEGMSEDIGRLVTWCLLRALIKSGHGAIEDPGITSSRLREAGIDPACLDRGARGVLASPEAPGTILVGHLLRYDVSGAARGPRVDDEGIGSTGGPPPAALALSLRWIDTASGMVASGGTEYIELQPDRGLFGAMKSISVVRRVQPAADRLVLAALKKG